MMRRFLLDTHVLLWSLYKSSKLPIEIKELINSNNNQVFYSVANLWEIEIKHDKHPELMPTSSNDVFNRAEIMYDIIRIEPEHIRELSNLPKIHADPFDRILIAQAKVESLELITADEKISQYDYPFILSFTPHK